ncbi:MAG: hypothetical protein ACOWWM_13580 [Desulfobacterales bacterium]
MRLPGGLWIEGGLRRDFAFKPASGAVERALQAAGQAEACLPDRVTRALSVSIERIGGAEPNSELTAGLAVGDRQFLMRRLAVHLGLNETWMTSVCRRCGSPFDYFIDHGRLPVKEAGPGFPFVDVETRRGMIRLRVPGGSEQAAIAGLDDPESILRILVSRCLVDTPGEAGAKRKFPVDRLDAEDFKRIESALETTAPEVTTRVRVECSECGTGHLIDVDPYLVLGRVGTDLDREIHVIASTYHWSEKDILELPTARRKRYLELIDQTAGTGA